LETLESNAIIHVLRCFDNDNIVHVDGNVNPIRDRDYRYRVQLKDLDTVEKRLEKVNRAAKTGNKRQTEKHFGQNQRNFASGKICENYHSSGT
jgi:ribosome-binding ATPase YchF (GTP1/OBG family)